VSIWAATFWTAGCSAPEDLRLCKSPRRAPNRNPDVLFFQSVELSGLAGEKELSRPIFRPAPDRVRLQGIRFRTRLSIIEQLCRAFDRLQFGGRSSDCAKWPSMKSRKSAASERHLLTMTGRRGSALETSQVAASAPPFALLSKMSNSSPPIRLVRSQLGNPPTDAPHPLEVALQRGDSPDCERRSLAGDARAGKAEPWRHGPALLPKRPRPVEWRPLSRFRPGSWEGAGPN
jgi:hypothetical protein